MHRLLNSGRHLLLLVILAFTLGSAFSQTNTPTYEIVEKAARFSIIKLDGLYGVIDTNRVEQVPAKYTSYEKKTTLLGEYELVFFKDENGITYIFHPLKLKLTRVAGKIVEINSGKHLFCFLRLSDNKWKRYNFNKAMIEPEVYDSIEIRDEINALGFTAEGTMTFTGSDKSFTPKKYSDFKYVNSGLGKTVLTELNGAKSELTYDSIKQRDYSKIYAAFNGSTVTLYVKEFEKWKPYTIELNKYNLIETIFEYGNGRVSARINKNGLIGVYYIDINNFVPPVFTLDKYDSYGNILFFYQTGWYSAYNLGDNKIRITNTSFCDSCHGTGKIVGKTKTIEIIGDWVPPKKGSYNSYATQKDEKGRTKTIVTGTTEVEMEKGYYKKTYKKVKDPDVICPICKGEKTTKEKTLIWDGKQLKEIK